MSRKYKQRGYMEGAESAGGQPRRGPRGPREGRDGPRGRGLGAPQATAFKCARCGTRLDPDGATRDAVCKKCGSDLHTCTHCAHFDTSAPFECRQKIPVRISAKAKRNDCELFKVKLTQEFAREPQSASDAKAAFDDLFDF